MRRIRMIIEYDGTAYVGWQTQPNGTAIQALLEEQLFSVTGDRITLHASGRTDSGVHALAQVAHFDTHARMPADKFTYALNTGLPRDIRVRFAEDAPEDFHARFHAERKHYRYSVLHSAHARVFLRNTALHVHGALDEAAMQAEAEAVLGTHDFLAFMAAGTTLENTTRTIFRSEWTRLDDMLYYDVEGSGFLYNMVRILAGTMLAVGKGTLPPGTLLRALQNRSRADAGPTAPAHGLMLMRVVYPGFDTEEVLHHTMSLL
ncbi:tRNA pseudouridine(38-40) synthase TruA [Christensenellaceae bacterium OttesenSCG-928-L17]|nr:tRNA pseudouridine(38-40) synthase TruA [Christensenellaceae bacterium OttesenSCG-928-L17]